MTIRKNIHFSHHKKQNPTHTRKKKLKKMTRGKSLGKPFSHQLLRIKINYFRYTKMKAVVIFLLENYLHQYSSKCSSISANAVKKENSALNQLKIFQKKNYKCV